MDNRVNEYRRKVRLLRADMLVVQQAVRAQISQDQDCTEASFRLLGMRRELSALVQELTVLGGVERLPTVEERWKERRHVVRRVQPANVPLKLNLEKRRLAARG